MEDVKFYTLTKSQLFYLVRIITDFDIKDIKIEDIKIEIVPDYNTQYLYKLDQTPWKACIKIPLKKDGKKLPYFYEIVVCVDGQIFYMNDGVQLRWAWPMKVFAILNHWKFPMVELIPKPKL